jgi:hypothetical protein
MPIPYAHSPRVNARYATATALYYNQSTWENYWTNLFEEMHYAGLTREEKGTALILGYANL